jgi:propanediol dehydratase small subunit
MKTIIIGICIGLIILIGSIFIDQIPKFYRKRNCQGIYWRRRYPNIPKEEIKKFLQIFIDAFAFKEKHRCKFKPEDKVMDIYNALYPNKFLSADGMELEDFAMDLKNEYNVDLGKIWNEEITFGQIFEEVIKGKSPTISMHPTPHPRCG